MGIHVQLGVSDQVPALDAPAVSNQMQQGFWGGAQAGKKQVGGLKGFAVAATRGRKLDDPAGADPLRASSGNNAVIFSTAVAISMPTGGCLGSPSRRWGEVPRCTLRECLDNLLLKPLT